jgi:hypothetical protein
MTKFVLIALAAWLITQETASACFSRHRRVCCPPCRVDEGKLAPDIAKRALLEMMRSEPGKKFGWFEGDLPEKMSKMEISEMKMASGEHGWYAWSVFHLNSTKEIYTFTIRPREGVKACAFTYEGKFQKKNGVWTASVPKLVSTALQGP